MDDPLGPVPMDAPPGPRLVEGFCPVGCGRTLVLDDGGRVTCSEPGCLEPDAVATLLDDPETDHLATITATGFTVRHPLRERLRGDLERCELHQQIAGLPDPPVRPGRYRAVQLQSPPGRPSRWRFGPVEEVSCG
jgi:hypothetical protein